VRHFVLSSSILLVLSPALVFAGGYNYQKEDLSGYSLQPDTGSRGDNESVRTGHSIYLFGGYVFADRFLSSDAKTIYDASGSTLTYIPSKAVPNTFNGLQVGIGKQVSTHFDLQASYIQDFEAKKSSVYQGLNYLFKVKSNGLLGDFEYIFNPYSDFQAGLQVGAMITEITNTISVDNSPYYTVSDTTKIDPAGGLELLYQFSQDFGVRMSGLYIAETQGTNSHGQIDAIVSLSYIV
jgi:hypothetical protein